MRAAATRLVELRGRLRERRAAHADLRHAIDGNGGGYAVGDLQATEVELQAIGAEVESCLERLAGLGVLVKDLDSGLVDFPSDRYGEPVLLCWRVGEDAVAFWHDSSSGFAGRSPIDWDAT